MPANDYCTASDVKTVMPDGNWGTGYDTLLGLLVTRASRAVDTFVMRLPGAFAVTVDVTAYFDGSGTRYQWIGELAAAPTSVAVAETGSVDNAAGTGGNYTTWTVSDYVCWPYNAPLESEPYQRLDINYFIGSKAVWFPYPKAVKVVGKFGFSTTVPDDVKQATIIQAARWFKRGQQAFQDTGAVTELGQLHYTQRLDPDVANILAYLRRVTT